jgi:hypothetical protein
MPQTWTPGSLMPLLKVPRALTLPAAVCLFIASSLAAPARAQTADLETCQDLKAKIDYYTDLRRGGGTALRMESWKQQRSVYEEKFREYACHKYGKDLYQDKG